MSTNIASYGAIDCDIHPAVPNMRALLPYLNEYWREAIVSRGIANANQDLTSVSAQRSAVGAARSQAREGQCRHRHRAAKSQALDAFGTRFAIANVLHGALVYANEYMAAALCGAVNDWMAKEWLDADPRLRASILVPAESPDAAVEEIERLAHDKRFVQVLLLVMGGHSARQALLLADLRGGGKARHADRRARGSMYRNAPTSIGWAAISSKTTSRNRRRLKASC